MLFIICDDLKTVEFFFTAGPCFDNTSHAINASNDSYNSTLCNNLSDTSRNIKELLNSNGVRRHRVLNAASTVLEAPSEVVWVDSNLTNNTYSAILKSLLDEANSTYSKRPIPPLHKPSAKRHQSEPGRYRYEEEPSDSDRARERHHSHPHASSHERTGYDWSSRSSET